MRPDWLPDLVLLDTYRGDWNLYIEALYTFFKKDFLDNDVYFNGLKIFIKTEPKKDGKEPSFWHLITEGDIEENREPERRRCERIRWSKPIIENYNQKCILYWEKVRNNKTHIYFWLVQEQYIVILTRRKKHFMFITAYVTEGYRKKQFRKDYLKYCRLKK